MILGGKGVECGGHGNTMRHETSNRRVFGLSAITPVVLMGHTVWSGPSLSILLQGPRTVAMLVAL